MGSDAARLPLSAAEEPLILHQYKKELLKMNSKQIKWSTLAFMAFSTVWGFGNVLNGFVYFNGIQRAAESAHGS